MRRGAVIEVLEIGEVTVATALAGAEKPVDGDGAEGAPVEETAGVRA